MDPKKPVPPSNPPVNNPPPPIQPQAAPQTPTVSQQPVPQTAPSPPPPKKFSLPKINLKRIAVLLIVFIIFGGIIGGSLAVAYEKISINNPKVEEGIRSFVLGLPFMPKTPKYILESAISSHKRIAKHTFDISMVVKSDDYLTTLGFSEIDLVAKGAVDYTDPKKLKVKLNANITKELNLDLRSTDEKVYIKINTFPKIITTFLQIDYEKIKPVFDNWIVFDNKPLETQARAYLDKAAEEKQNPTEDFLEGIFNILQDERLLKEIKSSSEKVDGFDTYKFSLKPSDSLLDYLMYKLEDVNYKGQRKITQDGLKPSDSIKDLILDVWFDKGESYVRQVATSFRVKPTSPNSDLQTNVLGITNLLDVPKTPSGPGISPNFNFGRSESKVASVVKFSDYGQGFNVDVPEKVLKFEEFYAQLLKSSGLLEKYGSPSAELANPL